MDWLVASLITMFFFFTGVAIYYRGKEDGLREAWKIYEGEIEDE